MFSINKYDDISCTVCLSPRLNNGVFSTLSHLPGPVPNGEHYKSFDDIYGSTTSECHLPSLHEKEAKGHKIPFNPSAQTAKNTGILLICEECIKPRLTHSQRKSTRSFGWIVYSNMSSTVAASIFMALTLTKMIRRRSAVVKRVEHISAIVLVNI